MADSPSTSGLGVDLLSAYARPLSTIRKNLFSLFAVLLDTRRSTFGDFETIVALNMTAERDFALGCFAVIDRTVLNGWRRFVFANCLVFRIAKRSAGLMF